MRRGEVAFLDARAELADLKAWAGVHAAAFPDESWGVESLARLLGQPGAFAVLAPGNAPARGCALVRVPGDDAELLTLGVAPEARRQGLGQSLVAAAAGRAAGLGARRLLLEVGAGNTAARALYKRFGFAELGRRPNYYDRPQGGSRDALVLARLLPSPGGGDWGDGGAAR